MNLEVDFERLLLAQKMVRAELLAERSPAGCWPGQLASSPVATAAAVSALVVSHHEDSDDVLRQEAGTGAVSQLVQGDLSELLLESVHWLARQQNDDGGWSDCPGAESNLAATLLVQAAFRLTGIPAKYADLMVRADQFVSAEGGLSGLKRQLNADRTYLAAVLANCSIADLLPWRHVPTLSFERYWLPKRWRQELPAPASQFQSPIAIAVGLAKFHNDAPHNPVMRLIRRGLRKKSLAAVVQSQAADDSFLGSPLATAFIVMCLSSMGDQESAIVRRGVEFLLSSVRSDASWSLVANLSTTNSALAMEGLFADRAQTLEAARQKLHDSSLHSTPWQDTATTRDTAVDSHVSHAHTHHVADELADAGRQCVEWILNTQRTSSSLLTNAPVGGWGASDAAGAEPNTIATSAALATLANVAHLEIGVQRGRIERGGTLGVNWLLAMQNDDGGWPTYCRNDNAQSLDASGVDPTAQALRALAMWRKHWSTSAQAAQSSASLTMSLDKRIAASVERAIRFLEHQQRDDGSFVPLWFGNVQQPEDENPVMGTSAVLAACAELQLLDANMTRRAATWLQAAQHSNGAWGPPRAPVDYSDNEPEVGLRSWRENDTLAKECSIEETSAAIAALLPFALANPAGEASVSRGLAWLANAVEHDGDRPPAVIGFYLGRIWYYERLYPLAFAAGTLSRAVGALASVKPVDAPVA
jgi:squalene-hopene/tetraprenyl-beta-curcumene cyclase